jgi:pimeloyl-ACP methyl ester carboxylesterase
MSTQEQDYRAAEKRLLEAHGLEADVRDVRFDCIDGEAHVIEVGDGPPVLFIQGGGAPGAAWAPLVAHLDGFRRIMVDRPGFGLTTSVRHEHQTMRRLAVTFVGELLDRLGLETAPIVGNSMGSWWSTRFALAAPQRVDALVHIGCPAILLDTSAPLPMRLMGVRGLGDLLIRLQPPSPKQARFMLRMMGDPLGDGDADHAMADLLIAMQQLPSYRRTWLDLLHAFVGPFGARPHTALTEEDLRRLNMPVLFVWGERDTFGSPDVGRRAVHVMPHAEMVTIPYGHVPWVSNAAAVAQPIRTFLETRRAVTPS